MSTRVATAVALAVVAASVALVGFGGGGAGTRLDLELSNASGIRQGTLVKVGGARVGVVDSISIDDSERVLARLELDKDRVTPGAGARAAISSVNLVGAKFVDLDPGDEKAPLPDGSRIPQQRIGVSTELDEVLDVLDPDVRARLEILLNEAGVAFRGRRADLRASLRGLPPFLAAVNDMLGDLAADNHALGALIERADGAVSKVTAERRALGQLVDDAGRAMQTVSGRREALRATLARSPDALNELTRLLRELEATAAPLGPAARTLQRTAPALNDTLAKLPGFQEAAQPTLAEIERTGPRLSDLGRRATPTLRQARPVVANLRDVITDSKPLTQAADTGIEDLLGLIEGWARTIQARDAVGHAFRGHVTITRDLIDSLAKRLPDIAKRNKPRRTTPVGRAEPGRPSTPAQRLTDKLKPLLEEPLKKPLEQVKGLVDRVIGGVTPPSRSGPSDTGSLLDFLLGP